MSLNPPIDGIPISTADPNSQVQTFLQSLQPHAESHAERGKRKFSRALERESNEVDSFRGSSPFPEDQDQDIQGEHAQTSSQQGERVFSGLPSRGVALQSSEPSTIPFVRPLFRPPRQRPSPTDENNTTTATGAFTFHSAGPAGRPDWAELRALDAEKRRKERVTKRREKSAILKPKSLPPQPTSDPITPRDRPTLMGGSGKSGELPEDGYLSEDSGRPANPKKKKRRHIASLIPDDMRDFQSKNVFVGRVTMRLGQGSKTGLFGRGLSSKPIRGLHDKETGSSTRRSSRNNTSHPYGHTSQDDPWRRPTRPATLSSRSITSRHSTTGSLAAHNRSIEQCIRRMPSPGITTSTSWPSFSTAERQPSETPAYQTGWCPPQPVRRHDHSPPRSYPKVDHMFEQSLLNRDDPMESLNNAFASNLSFPVPENQQDDSTHQQRYYREPSPSPPPQVYGDSTMSQSQPFYEGYPMTRGAAVSSISHPSRFGGNPGASWEETDPSGPLNTDRTFQQPPFLQTPFNPRPSGHSGSSMRFGYPSTQEMETPHQAQRSFQVQNPFSSPQGASSDPHTNLEANMDDEGSYSLRPMNQHNTHYQNNNENVEGNDDMETDNSHQEMIYQLTPQIPSTPAFNFSLAPPSPPRGNHLNDPRYQTPQRLPTFNFNDSSPPLPWDTAGNVGPSLTSRHNNPYGVGQLEGSQILRSPMLGNQGGGGASQADYAAVWGMTSRPL